MSGECDKCGEHTLDCECEGDLCNDEGEEMLCNCGNPAQAVIMGKESYVTRCNDCVGI